MIVDAKVIAMIDDLPRPALVMLLDDVGIATGICSKRESLAALVKDYYADHYIHADEIIAAWEDVTANDMDADLLRRERGLAP